MVEQLHYLNTLWNVQAFVSWEVIMQMYRARYLLTLSIEELMQLPMCDGNVVYFDDGELTASTE